MSSCSIGRRILALVCVTSEQSTSTMELPSEAPRTEDLETGERSAVSIADFVNVWSDYRGTVYGGYLISDTAPAGLTLIYAPAPLPEASVNLLNLFYALEWLIFAGFAFYLWYRLVMDEVEKEVEAATVD